MANQVSNIVIEPVDAIYGACHRSKFGATAGTSLSAKYFLVSSTSVDYYVWYNTGASVDPAVAGRTGVEVAILAGDSAAEVAEKTVDEINLANVTLGLNAAVVDSSYILIENMLQGAPLSVSAAGNSTFTVSVVKQGFSLELGYIEGDVEVGLDEQLFDVTAHQTGTQLLGQLRTGVTAGPITLTLKEAIAAKLKALIEAGIGEEYTPSEGMTPTAVTAVGALAGSKQFQNVTSDGGKLVLHPTKNVSTNYSEDLAFWLAYPKLNSVKFSGEENKSVEVEFSIFLDESKVNDASVFVYGDHTQNFLKSS